MEGYIIKIRMTKVKGLLLIVFGVLLALCITLAGLYIAEEARLDKLQQTALEELEENKGAYDEHTIVLYDTSESEAEALADNFNAKLRITGDGKFATLTLSEEVSVYDVYSARANRAYLPLLSLDYYARTSAEGDESGEHLPSRPDYTVTDDYYSRQSYLDYMNIGEAWNATRGSGITVAVIDTGIDIDHPEFAGRISEYSYNATEDKIVKDYTLDDGSYDWSLIEDEQGHGTAVSGVIAAAMDGSGVAGIASEVEILVIKAECDENGSFYNTSDLVFGLYYAVERDVDVVNMSFGGYSAVNPYASAAKLAVDSNIVCVAAAGNDGATALSYPAADENVIGVGALAQNSWELASYSNYGDNSDIVAPGTVYTSLNGGGYGVMNGTSFAAPAAAASVALYLAQNRYSEVAEVREMLYASSYDLGSLGNDWYFGYGAIDVNALICEERGTVTFNMLTDELEDIEQVFIRNHTLQNLPEPERLYAVFDGWYFDIECTEELQWYEDVFTTDITLYANWVNEDDGVPYTYVTLDDGTVEIRSYTGHRRYITIPDMIDGKSVSSIGDFAFEGQTRLRQINLPSGLTNIGRHAFDGCSSLVEISIPAGVTDIGEYAFYDNVRLSAVAFSGNELTEIGDFAFAYCSSLARLELPSGVVDMDGSVFYGDTSLTSIGVRQGSKAFSSVSGVLYNHTGSTLVAYPAGLRNDYSAPSNLRAIGDYAFAYARLTEVGLGNVQMIGGNAFAYSALESLVIPDTVTGMGGSAFAMNFYLREITFGRGLNNIPQAAFYGCFELASVHIPANIRSIGANAFAQCNSLTELTFEAGSGLTQIGANAFAASALKEIGLPASLVMIGSGAFADNYALSSVAFGTDSTLQVIGEEAFRNAYSLAQISLPENLMSIGSYAFINSGLTSIELPASLAGLGAGAFASCGELEQIAVADGNEYYKDIDGVVYNTGATEIVAYPAGKDLTSYTVESTVTVIGEAAFYGAGTLAEIILPEGLETVGAYGFYGCTGILTYELPETLVYIEDYAFAQNASLTGVAIPDAVYQIGRYAFAYDYSLRNIAFTENSTLPRIGYAAFGYTGLYSFRVPASVSTIAQEAFIGCKDLTSITFAANSRLESISAYMFKGCDGLRTITFENGSALTDIQAHGLEGMGNLTTVNFGDAKLTYIENYAFRYNERLANISIPSTVEYIGRYAFYGCSALTRLDLPSGIDYIGRYAFYGADNLNIYFKGETLPLNLQENWDAGIAGYYVGVQDVVTSGDWAYAVLNSGNISIIKYNGTDTDIDLTAIDLGGDIVSIGGYAFYDTAVTDIVLPETLTGIQQYAFARSNISSVVIPASVEYIAKYAFFYTPLASVTFAQDSGLKVMEQWAFAYTRELDAIELPASLQTMGSSVFYHSGIISVTFAQGSVIPEIPESAFASSALMSVVLPDSVTLVNDNAFRDCATLQSVTFGAGEDLQLMSNVFYNTGLTSLHIPENLTYIGEYALVGLQGLEEFTVDENNPEYASVNGVLYDKEVSKIIAVPAGKTGSLTLPETLETIGYGAFENSSLEEISFDENSNILAIGYRAFYGADSLTQITIPASVVTIDYYAFAMCENLETVIFAEGSRLTGVYEGAFYGCKALTDIVLPDSVVEISDFAFYGCISLTQLPVSEDNQLVGIYSYAFAYTGISELNLPETLVELGQYAFRGAKLTKVVIPDTNREQLIIGLGAFADCNDLVEITLPFIGASFEDDEITWFGYIFGAGAYEANNTYVPDNLKAVTISEGITFVGEFAFYGIKTIEKINIPHSVTMVYKNAFIGCDARYTFTNALNFEEGNSVYGDYFSEGLYGDIILNEGIKELGEVFSRTNITAVKLPESLNYLGYAFADCIYLKTITIPASITTIGNNTFLNCINLTDVQFEDGSLLKTIGMDAFSGCSGLKNICLPSSITIIEDRAFNNCISLIDVCFEEDSRLTEFGHSTFAGCVNLESIEIPTGVTRIDDYTFRGCDKIGNVFLHDMKIWATTQICSYFDRGVKIYLDGELIKNLIIPEGVSTISELAFAGKEYIESAQIASSVTTIEDYAFSDCGNLKNVEFAENSGLVAIKNGVFYGCASLESITLPESLTQLGIEVFRDCIKLLNVEFGADSGITEFGIMAFSGCSSLQKITVPKAVKKIGNQVFENCSSLRQVEIPDGVISSIGTYAFIDCVSLQSIIIPESVTQMGNSIFAGCSGMTDVQILAHVTEIPSSIFNGCSNLVSVDLSESIEQIGSNAFAGCGSLVNIELPAGVTNIGGGAFRSCSNLESIDLPDNIIQINSEVFSSCTSLKEIAWPNNLITIEGNAFNGCSQLNDLAIPAGVDIMPYAFADCGGLKNIYIPSKCGYIDAAAFGGCKGIQNIYLDDLFAWCSTELSSSFEAGRNLYVQGELITDLQIPEGITVITSNAFAENNDIVSVSFPASVITIENNAFSNCINLKNIEFADGSLLNSIENEAFYSCGNLYGLILPTSIEIIGDNAFYGCYNLREIENYSNLQITIGQSDYGYVAYYAEVIADKEGNKTYRDGTDSFTYFDTDDGLRFAVVNGEYTLLEYFGGEDTVTLPATINGNSYAMYQVKGVVNVILSEGIAIIDHSAFNGCDTLLSVILPESIVRIDAYAFSGCTGLQNIIIPDSVKSIGVYAFSGCSNLKSVNISDSSNLSYIEDEAFKACSNLNNINFPDSLSRLGDNVFAGCGSLSDFHIDDSNINFKVRDGVIYNSDMTAILYILESTTEIVVPATVNNISGVFTNKVSIKKISFEQDSAVTNFANAFWGCSNLETVILPDGVKTLEQTFYDCTRLQNVELPDSIIEIGSGAFQGCESLESIIIPDGVTSIGYGAFRGCSNLKSLDLPDGITEISEYLFEGCSELTTVHLPDGLKKIGGNAFMYCCNLKSVSFPDGLEIIGDGAFSSCDNLGDIVLPDSVIDIGLAFYYCTGLQSIKLSEKITVIEDTAFYNCSSLVNIVIPDGITEIGSAAFYGCSSLLNIEIPDSVSVIGGSAFSGCNSLITIKIPNGVKVINAQAFYNCANLESIILPEGIVEIGEMAFWGCVKLKSVILPEGVQIIGDMAFYDCNNLIKANLPSSLIEIGEDIFKFCDNLEYLEIFVDSDVIGENTLNNSDIVGIINIRDIAEWFAMQDKIPKCGDLYFNGSLLTQVVIPEGVTQIPSYVFESNDNIISVSIPASVESIGDYAFNMCTNLASVEFAEGSELISIGVRAFRYTSLMSLTLPETVQNIGQYAFASCRKLSDINLPSNFTVIADGIFSYTNLKNIELPEGITHIGSEAFSGSSLNILRLPDSLLSIGQSAFSFCYGLVSIELPENIESIDENAFNGCEILYQIINNSNLELTIGSEENGKVAYYANTIIDASGNITHKDPDLPYYCIDTPGGFRFIFENNTYKLVSYLGDEETVTLPADINGSSYMLYRMTGVKNVIVPDGIARIDEYAFAECNSLQSIVIPASVENIGYQAFYNCTNLSSVQIKDNSNLNRIDNMAFSGCSYLTSFSFGSNNQQASLVIGNNAFSGCISLENIILPAQVTSIEAYAFSDCNRLSNIVLPDSITYITYRVFDNTAYYNDASNWVDGCLYIGNHLIAVSDSVEYFVVKESTGAIASSAFEGCYELVSVTISGDHSGLFSSITNLETLIITEMPSHSIYKYFGSSSSVPLTLKTIVLEEGVQIKRPDMFEYLKGITIYVEDNELDVMWDEDYPNWNNGNTVYYGDDWINATFYDVDGNILDSGYYLTSQVVRQPYYEIASDEQFDYVMVGWDLNGDGIADCVPATSAQDISAYAVIEQSLRNYTVAFLDADGTPLYTYTLPYETIIEAPLPVKTGYTFLGWDRYTDGMTVAGDMSFTAMWQHDGDGHDYNITEVVDPTCTEQGYTKHICTICGEWYATDYVEASGHSFGELLTKEATCTEDGYTYYACMNCPYEEIVEGIPATGHNYGEWITETAATCTADGLRYRVCEECGARVEETIAAIGHDYIGSVTKEPTCEEYGEITYTCRYCGDTVTERLDKTEHNYVKKYVPKSWLRWLVETLLNIFFGYEGNDGYYFECTDCRHIQTSEEALLASSVQSTCDHVLGEERLALAATCEGQGVYGRYCTLCGELIEARTVDALGHEYSTTVVAPTCSEVGYTLHKCSCCDDYYITDIVEKVAHTPGEAVRENEVAATCESAGSYETVIYCTECGAEISREETEIPAFGHASSEWIVDVEADCTHDGSRHKVCTVCGKLLDTDTIGATGHSYGETLTVEATCETAGYTYHVCDICGHEEKLSDISATGHTEGEWIVEVEADCTHDGSRHKVCTVCGKLLDTDTIGATGHSYGETLTVEATCETAGYTYHVCDICGHEEKLSDISATGHTEGEWIVEVEADCTHDGSRHKVCTVCGKLLKTETIEAAGHSYGETLTVEATCETAGYTYHVCDACDYFERVSDIPATGHTSGEAVREHEVAAKCESVGSYEIVIYCTECGVEISREKTEIPALGHTPGEWIVDVEATETNEGERHIDCSICGKELFRETIPEIPVIPEPGMSVGTVAAIAAGSAAGVGGCSGLLVWLILRKRRRI